MDSRGSRRHRVRARILVKGEHLSLQRVLFVPDVHRPAHDRRAWRLLLKAAEGFRPDHLVIMGDFIDCFSVSTYSKDISRFGGLEKEIEDGNKGLDELDALKVPGKKIYLAGNHEWRLERYLLDKAPQLLPFVDVPRLLDLDKRGWRYVPYKQHCRLGKIYLTHDVGSAGRYNVFRTLDAFQHSAVTAHTHRFAYIVEGSAVGDRMVSAQFGWLGDVKKVDYMHAVRANRDWALGFGVGYMEPSGVMHIQPVPIVNYRVVVGGELYRA